MGDFEVKFQGSVPVNIQVIFKKKHEWLPENTQLHGFMAEMTKSCLALHRESTVGDETGDAEGIEPLKMGGDEFSLRR